MDDIEGTVRNYVAPADGARSDLGGAEIRIGTRGSVRRHGASGAHRSERRGFWGAFDAIRAWVIDFLTKIVNEL